jgi:pectate disaccharide-lyase
MWGTVERVVRRRRLTVWALAIGAVCLLAWIAVPWGYSSGGAADRGVHRFVSPSGSDRAAGTRAEPWRTIGHAAGRVHPGDTVHVAPGRYRGPLTIERGGTANRRVRFVSQRRWGARISAGGTGAVSVVTISGDHVTFKGFDVTGRGGDGTAGIQVEGSHDAVVGNRVHSLDAPCLESGNGAAGIVVGGPGYRNEGGHVDGNVVDRIGRRPRDGTCTLVHGIYAAVPATTIVNNVVTRAAGDGITSWHAASKLTVANNLAARNGGSGVLIGSGDAGATAAGHRCTLVSNNIVYRNGRIGITEGSDGAHPVGPGNRYLNNLAYGNDGGDTSAGSGVAGMFPGATVAGTLNQDPGFARRPRAGRRPYRLRRTSPAVDAGTRSGAPRRDFDRRRRARGRGIDIGPYEQP